MQKPSFLFLLIAIGIALLAAYQPFIPALMPVSLIIRFLGMASFFLLCISLMIGPLAVLKPQTFAPLIESRRAVGITSFVFLFLHYMLVLALYFNFDFNALLAQFPLALAMPALWIMLIITLVSSDWATNKLGMGKWKTIQRFAYVAFLLGFAHFLLVSNGLYSRDGNAITVNFAEIALVALGTITVILQIVGFLTFRKRQAASRAATQPSSKPEEK